MKKKFSLNTESFAKYGFRLAYIDSDFLGYEYTFYFVPIDNDKIVFLSEMCVLCLEVFGDNTKLFLNHKNYPFVFQCKVFV